MDYNAAALSDRIQLTQMKNDEHIVPNVVTVPDITVIIPHYNIPDLLKRCLDSIPLDSSIEVIIVDDNSDPCIVDFSQFPGLNRPYTHCLFPKDGKGAGYARNQALPFIKGKWVLFADADDFFSEHAFKYISKYIDSDYDVVYFNGDSRMSDDLSVISHRRDWYNKIIKQNDIKRMKYCSNIPMLKLIKSNLIANYNLKFQEQCVSNDVIFSLYVGIYSRFATIDNQILMTITERRDSLFCHKHTKEERLIRFNTEIEHNRIVSQVHKNQYCNNGLTYFFGARITDFQDWLPIKSLLKYIYYTRFCLLKQIYWIFKK